MEKAKALGIAFAGNTMNGEKGKCLQTILMKLQKLLDDMTNALDTAGMKPKNKHR
jgi:hypothetical protein